MTPPPVESFLITLVLSDTLSGQLQPPTESALHWSFEKRLNSHDPDARPPVPQPKKSLLRSRRCLQFVPQPTDVQSAGSTDVFSGDAQ